MNRRFWPVTAGTAGLVFFAWASTVGAQTLAASDSPAQQVLFVSPQGDDRHAGTEAQPLRTLARARDLVRSLTATMTSDIVVCLHDGVHVLDQPVVLDHRDSGMNGHRVIYRNGPGAKPVIGGGCRITGWNLDAANRWKAHTDLANFRQLYVNGVRAVRARGEVPPGTVLYGPDGYKTSRAAMADWRNPGDIELCYENLWAHGRCKVKDMRREGPDAIITMLQPWFEYARTKEGAHIKLPAYIENALELLDEPGEWYLDRQEHVVYYMPGSGEDMAAAEVIAPALDRLIVLEGTLDKPVHDVSFEGITFAHAGWLRPSEVGHVDIQANFTFDTGRLLKRKGGLTVIHNEAVKSPANVVCRAVRSVRFERCTFTKLGGAGIDLEHGSQENTISRCEFSDISGSAIQIGDVRQEDHHPTDARAMVKNNTVVNNYIHDVAREYKGGVGVFVGYTDGTTIAHNEICHLPYTGVSIGWGWGEEDAGGGNPNYYQPFRYDTPTVARNNRCEFNHIHHVMMEMQDGGGVYTLSNQPGTVIRGNHIHDNPGAPGGIYLDEGSGFIEVTGNLVYRVTKAMNSNNRAQNRTASCNEHDNLFNVVPDTAPAGTRPAEDARAATAREIMGNAGIEPDSIQSGGH